MQDSYASESKLIERDTYFWCNVQVNQIFIAHYTLALDTNRKVSTA